MCNMKKKNDIKDLRILYYKNGNLNASIRNVFLLTLSLEK